MMRTSAQTRLALLCLVGLGLPACGDSSDGLTRVRVNVRGVLSPAPDQFSVTATTSAGTASVAVPETPRTITLPTAFTLAFPKDRSGQVHVRVEARAGVTVLGSVEGDATLVPGDLVTLELDFGGTPLDGGVDGGGSDGGSDDAAVGDDGGGGSDAGGMTILSTVPADNDTAADPTALVTARASAPLDGTTASALSLLRGTTAVPGATSVVGDTVRFSPTGGRLALRTRYDGIISGALRSSTGAALASPYRGSVTTRDGSFGTQGTIATAGGQSIQVAMAADGSAIASWSQDDGNGYDVWVNRYAAGAWGTPRLLRQVNGGNAYQSSVAMTPGGDGIVLFGINVTGGTYQVRSYRYTASTNLWGAEQTVLDLTGNGGSPPRVGIDDAGNAYAAVANGASMYLLRSASGGGAWTSSGPYAVGTSYQGFFTLGVGGGGVAHAVWMLGPAGNTDLMASRYVAGAWTTPVAIDGAASGEPTYPNVAVGQDGDAVVGYHNATGVYYQLFAVGGTAWGAPSLMPGSGGGMYAAVAQGRGGRAIVIWQQGTIRAVEVRPGNTAPVAISTSASSQAPSIAIDRSGNALAAWQECPSGMQCTIHAARFNGTWVAPVQVGANGASNSYAPEVAVADDGTGMIVFQFPLMSATAFR